jgi:hypothetical protein
LCPAGDLRTSGDTLKGCSSAWPLQLKDGIASPVLDDGEVRRRFGCGCARDQAAASPVKDFSSSDDVLAKRRGPDIARLQGQGTRRCLHSIRRLELRPPPAPAPVVEAASRSGERSLLRSAGVVRNPGTLATEARFGVSGPIS